MTETSSDTFYLGLTMAGAISAGAYTAGVLDVLFEALDRHNARFEARRAVEEKAAAEGTDLPAEFADHPRHRVVLRVISGTSAGGVSAGLAVAGLIGARGDTGSDLQIAARHAVEHESPAGYSYRYEYVLKPLHHVWVEALDLWRPGEQPDGDGFLTGSDLTVAPVVSALNSGHIDVAASVSLEGIKWAGGPYRFLSQDLDLFLTTTNLQGVPYEVGFRGGSSPETKQSHAMAQHSTVRHFRISGLGAVEHHSPWLDAWGDDGIPLPLPAPMFAIDFEPGGGSPEWAHFKTAAIATGAFPVGLAPRIIAAEARDFGLADETGRSRGGAWPINLNPRVRGADGQPVDLRPKPHFGGDDPAAPVTFVAVDGGVANNEPFELARYTLRRRAVGEGVEQDPGEPFLLSNPRGAHEANAAVLMIDPFPEGPVFSPLTEEQAGALRGIVPAVQKLLPAMINQARFKPGELIEASATDIHSRYLIAPSRRETDEEAERRGAAPAPVRVGLSGAAAIASGAFGGFGGFFDRAFRSHDYMLGRRNGHSFLANYFTLAARNPILGLGRTDDDPVRVVDAGEDYYGRRPALPEWPRIRGQELDPILDHARTRISGVGAALVGYTGLDWFRKLALRRVWGGLGPLVGGVEKSVSRALRSIVIAELIDRDQHHDFRMGGDGRPYELWQRRVLVHLAQSGETPVPVEAEAGAPEPGLLDVLSGPEDGPEDRAATLENRLRPFLSALEADGHVWKAPARRRGEERYTLAVFKPGNAAVSHVSAFGSRLRSRLFG